MMKDQMTLEEIAKFAYLGYLDFIQKRTIDSSGVDKFYIDMNDITSADGKILIIRENHG